MKRKKAYKLHVSKDGKRWKWYMNCTFQTSKRAKEEIERLKREDLYKYFDIVPIFIPF